MMTTQPSASQRRHTHLGISECKNYYRPKPNTVLPDFRKPNLTWENSCFKDIVCLFHKGDVSNNLLKLEKIHKENPEIFRQQDEQGNSLLHYAMQIANDSFFPLMDFVFKKSQSVYHLTNNEGKTADAYIDRIKYYAPKVIHDIRSSYKQQNKESMIEKSGNANKIKQHIRKIVSQFSATKENPVSLQPYRLSEVMSGIVFTQYPPEFSKNHLTEQGLENYETKFPVSGNQLNVPDFEKHIYGLRAESDSLYHAQRPKREERATKGIGIAHACFFAGAPGVCFGNVSVKNGKITYLDNDSGHYRPNAYHLALAILKTEQFLDDNVKISVGSIHAFNAGKTVFVAETKEQAVKWAKQQIATKKQDDESWLTLKNETDSLKKTIKQQNPKLYQDFRKREKQIRLKDRMSVTDKCNDIKALWNDAYKTLS